MSYFKINYFSFLNLALQPNLPFQKRVSDVVFLFIVSTFLSNVLRFFPFTFFGNLKVISGRQPIFRSFYGQGKEYYLESLKERMLANNNKYYSSTSRRKREPHCILKLPRTSSIQNIFLYTEVLHYGIRSVNKTFYQLTLLCLYTTFSSQKYFDIPFSFLYSFSSEEVQVLYKVFVWLANHRVKRGRNRNYFKHKY